ncbi:MAG: hypothetical protein AABY07_00615, partial [Nanoarchaeota archaeon]
GELKPDDYICEDSLEMVKELSDKKYNIEIFTKGGSQCVYSALKHTPLNQLVESGEIQVTSVSTDRFNSHDRRTSDCYEEWDKRMGSQNKDLKAYITDREDEGLACLNANIPAAFVDRNQKYHGSDFQLDNGLWLMDDLSKTKNWLRYLQEGKNE